MAESEPHSTQSNSAEQHGSTPVGPKKSTLIISIHHCLDKEGRRNLMSDFHTVLAKEGDGKNVKPLEKNI